MWTILTYIYNSILILFIATHLLVGAIISFLVGLYIGVYLCQNYEIPRITEPSKLYEKFIFFVEQYRRKPSSSNSSSVSNLSKLEILQKPPVQAILSIVQADNGNNSPQSFIIPQEDKCNDVETEDDDGPVPTPTVILTEPEFEEWGADEPTGSGLTRRSSSQILEASLIINADNEQSSYTSKLMDE